MRNFIINMIVLLIFPPGHLFPQNDEIALVVSLPGENNGVRLGDVNGDGFDDFMTCSNEKTILHFGGENFITGNTVCFESSETEWLGVKLNYSGIGDINNDGFNDFAIRGEMAEWDIEHRYFVNIYYGGETIDTIPAATLRKNPLLMDEMFGEQISPVGDFNGDGYDDFIIGSWYNWTDAVGRVYLFLGGENISSESYILFTSGFVEDFYGCSIAGVGDINNDGYDDFMVGDWLLRGISSSAGEDHVYIYNGSSDTNNIVDKIISSDEIDFGRYIQKAGDIDNDGNNEFIISSLDNVHIFNNLGEIKTISGYGNCVTGNGNINNDEYSDFLLAGGQSLGIVSVFYGRQSISSTYDTQYEGAYAGDGFGQFISFIGDINDDGYEEFAISATSINDNAGVTYIYSLGNLTDVRETPGNITNFKLLQNYPNPFNPTTTIKFYLPQTNFASIKVYDSLGREIVTLVNNTVNEGYHEIEFNGENLSGGIYYYQLKTKGYSETKKLVLLK